MKLLAIIQLADFNGLQDNDAVARAALSRVYLISLFTVLISSVGFM